MLILLFFFFTFIGYQLRLWRISTSNLKDRESETARERHDADGSGCQAWPPAGHFILRTPVVLLVCVGVSIRERERDNDGSGCWPATGDAACGSRHR
uniref:Uncharacterized protein n=1 Tax=Helianthus annuus TaxID=4232 RepID=A0A251SGE6_HELAN